MGKLWRRLRFWLDERRHGRTLDDEIAIHRALEQDALERRGLSPSDAARGSRRALGNVTLAREDAREVWSWGLAEHLARDLRYALRALGRERTFAITAITTLGLAIAVTTTIFSVVYAALWRPLPFPSPDRLVAIYTTAIDARHDLASARDLLAWREETRSFDEIAASTSSGRRIVRGPSGPESLVTLPVTANFFRMLLASPAIGRWFDSGSREAGNEAVLTDACWRRVFDADPQAVGKTLILDGVPHTIVGVAPVDFRLEFMRAPDLFVSFDPASVQEPVRRRLAAIGRLAKGSSISTAAQELQAVAGRLAHDFPATNAKRGVSVEDLRSSYTGFNWRPLLFFLGASGFVLVLACTNVASLLLARALKRQRELAVRRALGGGTAVLARQLLVEGAVLASSGRPSVSCSRRGPSKCFRRGCPPTISAATPPFASTAGSFSSRCRRPLSFRSRSALRPRSSPAVSRSTSCWV